MECTYCGATNCDIAILDDVTKVCYACLDAFFTKCEVCGEYWDDSYVEFFALKDGRLICEHCREDFDDEDIDFDP